MLNLVHGDIGRSISILLLLSVLFTLHPDYVWASVSAPQTTTGTLLGTVLNETAAPLPGAVVRVINAENGFKYGARTDTTGTYRIDLLPAGIYDIIAEAPGYQPNSIPKYLVEVNRSKIVKPPPIQLQPIAAPPPPTPPPTATTPGTQANIDDVTIRGSATAEFITSLPLAGIRSFDTFALLVPGVTPPPQNKGANGPGIGPGVGTAGQFTVNGQRSRSNNFTIDGSDNNDQDVGVRRQGFTPSIPQSVESIREFQISTLLADAEAGRNIGGQINVVSKTGTNSPHGEIYDFFTNDELNARDFFDLTGGPSGGQDAFTRNQFGAAIGFPIVKERLSLFASFERQDINRVQETHFAVPTAAERARALSRTRNIRLGSEILSLFPFPNNPGGPYGANNFTNVLPAFADGNLFSIKADYQFSPFNRPSTFTARYNFTDDDTRIPAVDSAINASIDSDTRTQNIALTLNSELSARSSNQIRFSYGRTALGFSEVAGSPFIFQTPTLVRDFNGDRLPDPISGPLGRLLVTPFSPIGVDPFTFPQGRANNTFQIADTFITNQGRHSLKFGFDVRRVQFNSFLDRNYRPQLNFISNLILENNHMPAIGSGADFAGLGVSSDILQALAIVPDSTLGLRFTELNLFIHDNLRIHPRVTLDVGLRYERNSVPTDVNNRIEDAITIDDNELPPAPRDSFTAGFFRALNAQRAFLGGRDKIYEADNNNFAPRVGVAIDLTGDGRTSLRLGYGLFYDPILGNIISQSRNVFPSFLPANFGSMNDILIFDFIDTNPAYIGVGSSPLVQRGTINTIGLPRDMLLRGIGTLLLIDRLQLGFTLPDRKLRTPYVNQYSASFERALFDKYIVNVAFVGTLGRKLIRFRTPNGGSFQPVRATVNQGSVIIDRIFQDRPIPDLGAITIFESSANSNYNALQASLVRRTVDGFGFQLAYTYAHAIDEVSDIFDLAGSFALAQDELKRREELGAERASASFDVRHRFTAGFQYQLPFARANRLLDGFQISGILTLQTGQPFTVNSSVDVNADGNLTDRLDTTTGLIIKDDGPTRIRLAAGVSPLSLLANSDTPTNGAVGRNTFRAAGIAAFDMALDKRFVINEERALTLRVEAFNLFNRSHFAIPVRILEAPGFGSSVATSLPARTVQFALRFSF